mgnify:CR=1 FL=1
MNIAMTAINQPPNLDAVRYPQEGQSRLGLIVTILATKGNTDTEITTLSQFVQDNNANQELNIE